MIRKAEKTDLIIIKKITDACTQNLIDQNIFQWNKEYPSLATFEKDIKEEVLYVYIDKIKIVGCIMFSEEKDPHYNNVKWITPDGHNLYIHRLAVHPKNQKQGIGRKMMDFAENFGKEKGMKSIRLDTFSQNPRNIKFYRERGYKKLGDVYFSKQSKDPFHCFEKLIKRI